MENVVNQNKSEIVIKGRQFVDVKFDLQILGKTGYRTTLFYGYLLGTWLGDQDGKGTRFWPTQEDGFFHDGVNETFTFTGLGEQAQKVAIKKLVQLGYIEYKVVAYPGDSLPLRYFKILK